MHKPKKVRIENSSETLTAISSIFDKFLANQTTNTEIMTMLKDSIDDAAVKLDNIKGFFSNGFRQDLKDFFTKGHETQMSLLQNMRDESRTFHQENQELTANALRELLSDHRMHMQEIINGFGKLTDKYDEIQKTTVQIYEMMHKPWKWTKLIGTIIVAISGAIVAIVTLYLSLKGK